MRNVQSVFREYLKLDTQYAIQLKGNWGTGKTFFFENYLLDIVRTTPVVKYPKKKYKPIYVSLFGLKSVEEIATKIVLDFYQESSFGGYFKKSKLFGIKKGIRVSARVLKIFLLGFFAYKKLGNPNDVLVEATQIAKDFLSEEELFVCFDDFERIDQSLSLSDLIGYINTLVDARVKVMLICNEDLLKDKDEFKQLKDKVIGITVEHVNNLPATIESIVESRYSSDKPFRDKLLEQADVVLSFANCVQQNFRQVIFALDKLRHCYSIIENEIINPGQAISSKIKEASKGIALFVMAVAADFKAGLLSNSTKNAYQKINITLGEIFENDGEDEASVAEVNREDNAEILSKFLKKYNILKSDYVFYETIFDYIVGANEFIAEDFAREFIRVHNLDHGQTKPEYVIFKNLEPENYLKLSEEEYKRKTFEVIEYAKDGCYNPTDYLSIMYFLERHNNPLKLNLDEMRDVLIKGLEKAIRKGLQDVNLAFIQFQDSFSNLMSERTRAIYANGMNNFGAARDKNLNNLIAFVTDLLMDNPEGFAEEYSKGGNFQRIVVNNNIFLFMDLDLYVQKILSYNNYQLYIAQQVYKSCFIGIAQGLRTRNEIQKIHDKLSHAIQSPDINTNTIRYDQLTQLVSIQNRHLLQALATASEG